MESSPKSSSEQNVLVLLSTLMVLGYIAFNVWAIEMLGSSHLLHHPDVYELHAITDSKWANSPGHAAEGPAAKTNPSPPAPTGEDSGGPDDGAVERDMNKAGPDPDFHPTKWRPRIMAVVPINWPPVYDTRIEHHFGAILDTWGKHVDVLRFVVSATALEKNPASSFSWLPDRMKSGELMLGVPMTRDDDPKSRNIWEKMHRTWRKLGQEFLGEADYFTKVDVDAFLIGENLRVFGSYLNPDKPWYLGHTLYQRWGIQNLVYNSGTCYVLSREALRRLSIRLESIPTVCYKCGGSQCSDRSGAGEDPQTGGCLRDLGILPADTLDSNDRCRFLPFRPRDHLFNVKYTTDPKDWFWAHKGSIGRNQVGEDCCSPYPISFHNFKTYPPSVYDKNALYELEYFFHSAPYESRIAGMDPPSGKLFQYDPSALGFEIDEHRNKKGAAANEVIGLWVKDNAQRLEPTNT